MVTNCDTKLTSIESLKIPYPNDKIHVFITTQNIRGDGFQEGISESIKNLGKSVVTNTNVDFVQSIWVSPPIHQRYCGTFTSSDAKTKLSSWSSQSQGKVFVYRHPWGSQCVDSIWKEIKVVARGRLRPRHYRHVPRAPTCRGAPVRSKTNKNVIITVKKSMENYKNGDSVRRLFHTFCKS